MRYQNLLHEFVQNGTAIHDDIDKLQKSLGFRLPADYVEFLVKTNGGEGPIGEFGYACFWPLDELMKWNESYQVADYAPGLFLFGSDGGGEAFAFDTRKVPMSIVEVTFVSMSYDDIIHIAFDFESFLNALGSGVI